jgi:hypothetical protein
VRDLDAGRYLPRQRLVVEPRYQNGSHQRDMYDGSKAPQTQSAGEQDEALLQKLLHADNTGEE